MKVGLKPFLVVGLMAVVFIVVAKVVFTKLDVPYVSDVVKSV